MILADIDDDARAGRHPCQGRAGQGASARTPSRGVKARRHQRGRRRFPPSPRRRSNSAASTSSHLKRYRHFVLGADRGHRIVDVEPQHGHSTPTGYFLVSARSLPLCSSAGRTSVATSSSSPRKNGLAASAQCCGLLHGQGGRDPPAPAASRWKARGCRADPRQHRQPGRGAARGSKIWTGEWREQRAAAYKMAPDEPSKSITAKRSMLKLLGVSRKRISLRQCTSWRPTCRPNPPATSSMSTRGMRRVLRADSTTSW